MDGTEEETKDVKRIKGRTDRGKEDQRKRRERIYREV